MTETTPVQKHFTGTRSFALGLSALAAIVVICLWIGLWATLEYIFAGWGLFITFTLAFFVLWGVILPLCSILARSLARLHPLDTGKGRTNTILGIWVRTLLAADRQEHC